MVARQSFPVATQGTAAKTLMRPEQAFFPYAAIRKETLGKTRLTGHLWTKSWFIIKLSIVYLLSCGFEPGSLPKARKSWENTLFQRNATSGHVLYLGYRLADAMIAGAPEAWWEETLLLMLYGLHNLKLNSRCITFVASVDLVCTNAEDTAYFQVPQKWQQPSESSRVGPEIKTRRGHRRPSPHRPGEGGVPFPEAPFEDGPAGAVFDLCSLTLKRCVRPVIKYADSTSAVTGQPTCWFSKVSLFYIIYIHISNFSFTFWHKHSQRVSEEEIKLLVFEVCTTFWRSRRWNQDTWHAGWTFSKFVGSFEKKKKNPSG